MPQSQSKAAGDRVSEITGSPDREILVRSKNQRDASEQLTFNREIDEGVVEGKKLDAGFRGSSHYGNEADSAVRAIRCRGRNGKKRKPEFQAANLAQLLVQRNERLHHDH